MKLRRRPEPCHVCGWEDTRALCAHCGRPVCQGCARPATNGEGAGPAIEVGRFGRGRVCPCNAPRGADLPPQVDRCRCVERPGEEKPTGADALVAGPHHSILCDLWKGAS